MQDEHHQSNQRAESSEIPYAVSVQEGARAVKKAPAVPRGGWPWFPHLWDKPWRALRHWVQVNSFAPGWLPEPLRHPMVGYLVAALAQVVAVFATLLLIYLYPDFTLESLLLVLGVLLVALSWGAGPALFATLLSLPLLTYVDLPPGFYLGIDGGGDVVSLLLFLLVGLIISVVAGGVEQARRHSARLALSLAQEQSATERERLRLRTLFDVLPASVGMVDAQGQYLEKTPACKALWGEGTPMPREIADFKSAKAWWPDTRQPLGVEEWGMSRALTGGEIVTNKEVEIESSDGQRKVVLDSATPIRDETGAIIGAVGILQDITERRRLEEALRCSEREAAARASQLEAVFEAMADAVLVFDTQGRVLQRNAADRALFTFDTEPLSMADRYAQVQMFDENGQPLSRNQLCAPRVLKGELLKGEDALDIMARTSSGEYLLFNMTGAPVRDANGRITGGVLVKRDVTARRRLEREVARRAHELEVIFESIVDGVFVYDQEGRIMRANSAGRRLLNLDKHPELCALPADERIPRYQVCYQHNELLPQESWPLARMLRGEVLSDPNSVDVSYRGLDGRQVEASISGAPLRDADGQINGAVMVLRDLTEHQRLERRTHESLQGLLAMAEALVQAPGALAPPGEEIRSPANLVAHRLAQLVSNLLGCFSVSISALDLEQGISEPLAVLGLPPELEQRWWAGERRSARWLDVAHTELLARLQAGEMIVQDMTNPHQRDEPNPFNARMFFAFPMRIGERLVGLLILNPRGDPSHYTAQQIALAEAAARLGALVIERERLLREREAAQASELALREANRQMDAFLGMASHELKTPLTTVILGVQLAQRRIQTMLSDQISAADGAGTRLTILHEQLTRTNRQAERLERLVNDLLDVSRIQENRLELRLETTDLAPIVCEAIEEQRQANPQRVIQVHLAAGQRLPVSVDAGRIEQVVTNYLTNALKYSAEEQPIEVGADIEAGMARVWVRDKGSGLSASQQEHLWERFYRAPGIEVQSGSGIGLGLGLYISRTIVERHQGQVGVESAPGSGSTFWFTLPLAPP